LELNLKETESKYQELVASLKKEEGENLKKMGNDVNLSIQVSELKGKLEAKTKSFNEYQEEKEKQIEDLNSKINMMRKENLSLKELKVKYDVLQNELKKFSLEDMNNTKQRLIECEKTIKEKDDQINQLKSSDSHKILSEKIDELTKKNSDLENQVNELQEENDSVRQQLLIKECEITQLKESLPLNDENDPEKNNVQEKKEEKQDKASDNLVEGDSKKNNNNENIDLVKKIAELEKEKAQLNEQINELDAKIEKDKHFLEEQKDENEKMNKKLEKYKQIKKENKTFIDRIAELMEKLDEQKNENIKLVNDKSEIKNEYIATINKLQKDLAESEFKVKNMENQIKRLENEKDKSKDNSNAEALKLQTLEIKNDMSMQSEEKLKII
jgi:myosin protein heavy chain/myosin heavy chain 6/7